MFRSPKNRFSIFLILTLFFVLLASNSAYSQTKIELLERESKSRFVDVNVGEVVEIDIWVDLGSINIIAVYFYLTYDGDVFEIIDTKPQVEGIEPFDFRGGAFSNTVENSFENGNGIPGYQLNGGVDVGTGGTPLKGRLFIGTFKLKAVKEAENSKVYIDYDRTNLRDTRYRTNQSVSKKFSLGPRYAGEEGLPMVINVKGIGLNDIPNVYFQPGETYDEINLDDYVINTGFDLNELGWTYSGNNNVQVNVQEDSPHKVTFSSTGDWTGKETVKFRVTDLYGYFSEDNVVVTVGYSPEIINFTGGITFEEDTYYDIFVNDHINDPDDDSNEITWEARVDSGAINIEVHNDNRRIIVSSEKDWNGTGFITLFAYDRFDIPDSQTVKVTVTPVNDPPVISDIPDLIVPYNGVDSSLVLNDYIYDVDNLPSEITWSASGNEHSTINILVNRSNRAIIKPDSNYLGSDIIVFKATDPYNFYATDTVNIEIRKYPPKFIKQLPDTVITLTDSLIVPYVDLDEYIYDPDSKKENLSWSVYNQENILIEIDDEHNSFIKSPSLDFNGAENLIFAVQDPEGNVAEDTVNIVIISGEYPIIGDISDIYLPVGGSDSSIVLDNYVWDNKTSAEKIEWTYYGNNNIQIKINPDNRRITFSSPNINFLGTEMITLRATDTDGYYDEETVNVHVFPRDGSPVILGLPDVYITKNTPKTIDLNDYVFIYPEEMKPRLEWSFTGTEDKVDIEINNTTKEAEFSVKDPDFKGVRQFTFICTNPDSGKSDSDIIDVYVTYGKPPILGRMPDITFFSGQKDSSIHLNKYVVDFDTPVDSLSWFVAGNNNILYNNSYLQPGEDHILRLWSKSGFVGVETISIGVVDPEGNVASDTVRVQVLSPTSIDISVLVNPIDANFIDVIVISNDSLYGNPNIRIRFNESEDLITTSKISNAFMWKGDYIFPQEKSGLAKILAYAVDIYGTKHSDSLDFSLGFASKSLSFFLKHNKVSMILDKNSIDHSRTVAIVENDASYGKKRLKNVNGFSEIIYSFDLAPEKTQLTKNAVINIENLNFENSGLFRYEKDKNKVEFIKSEIADDKFTASIQNLGTYFIAKDEKPPDLEIAECCYVDNQLKIQYKCEDVGSGINIDKTQIVLNQVELSNNFIITEKEIIIRDISRLKQGENEISVRFSDNLDNKSRWVSKIFEISDFQIPKRYKLYQNYPNPFNPETEIRFDLPEFTKVKLEIYSVTGQLVRTIYDGDLKAGSHKFRWDGKNHFGVRVASGTYIYMLRTSNFRKSMKMILLK